MHWCLGMYGSASTWTFNVVQKVAAALMPDRPVASFFVNETLVDLDESGRTVVIKSHATPRCDELGRHARAVILTIRDPRDSLASMMAHNEVPFDVAVEVIEASALTCTRFLDHPGALLLRFDERFFDDPATISKIAGSFGGGLSDADRDRIFAETRREEVERFIAKMDGLPTVTTYFNELIGRDDTVEEVTAWHKHHAGRKGEDGRWRRELSAAQVAEIERRLWKWMEGFGYSPELPRQASYVLNVGQFGLTL